MTTDAEQLSAYNSESLCSDHHRFESKEAILLKPLSMENFKSEELVIGWENILNLLEML